MPRRSSRNSRASARRSVNKAVRHTREERRSLAVVPPLSFFPRDDDYDYTPPRAVRAYRRRDRRRAKQTSETDGSPTTGDLGRGEEVSEVGERGR